MMLSKSSRSFCREEDHFALGGGHRHIHAAGIEDVVPHGVDAVQGVGEVVVLPLGVEAAACGGLAEEQQVQRLLLEGVPVCVIRQDIPHAAAILAQGEYAVFRRLAPQDLLHLEVVVRKLS